MIDILPTQRTLHRHHTVLLEAFEAVGVSAGQYNRMHEQLQAAGALAIALADERLEIL